MASLVMASWAKAMGIKKGSSISATFKRLGCAEGSWANLGDRKVWARGRSYPAEGREKLRKKQRIHLTLDILPWIGSPPEVKCADRKNVARFGNGFKYVKLT